MELDIKKIATQLMSDSIVNKQNQGLPQTQKARNIQIREQAREMEAIFLTQMVKAMRKTIPKNPWGGSDNNLPSMMFGSIMGKALAEGGGVGLSEVIFNSLKKMDHTQMMQLQEIQSKQAAAEINTLDFIKSVKEE